MIADCAKLVLETKKEMQNTLESALFSGVQATTLWIKTDIATVTFKKIKLVAMEGQDTSQAIGDSLAESVRATNGLLN